ncbi:MAG: 50S ribosomal protein L4 [Thermoplasmata archaeon]
MHTTEAAAPTEPQEHKTPHHRAHVTSLQGKTGHTTVALPLAFSTPVRTDLIRRAVVAARSHRRQPYATSLTAGRRHSVRWSGKGRGVSRTPRLMDSMIGAQAPNTVGGGQAHPPRVERIWAKKINIRERRLAFASALAATRVAPLARARGHTIPESLRLPVVLETPVEEVDSTADARAILERLRLWEDVERAGARRQRRTGRAGRRGRVHRGPRSVLLVTSGPAKARGFRNLPGVDVVAAPRLSTEDLAPGGDPGRVTLFSVAAIEALRARLGEAAP